MKVAGTHTRDLLLQATLKLISERGYLGTTTKDIAHEAGVTEMTLYRHFGTKERLFEELLKDYSFLPKLIALLPELMGRGAEEALFLVGTRYLGTLKERKALIKIFYQEVTNYPEKVKEVYNRFTGEIRATLAGFIRSLQERGEVRKDLSPELATRALLSMFNTYFMQEEIMQPAGMNSRDMEKYVRDVINIFLHGASPDARPVGMLHAEEAVRR
jgi:AcrR family transcriptional regulator